MYMHIAPPHGPCCCDLDGNYTKEEPNATESQRASRAYNDRKNQKTMAKKEKQFTERKTEEG